MKKNGRAPHLRMPAPGGSSHVIFVSVHNEYGEQSLPPTLTMAPRLSVKPKNAPPTVMLKPPLVLQPMMLVPFCLQSPLPLPTTLTRSTLGSRPASTTSQQGAQSYTERRENYPKNQM